MFAETDTEDGINFSCETCNILLNAPNGEDALKAAQEWAMEYEAENAYRFVGVEELQWLSDERPGHGDELAGMSYQEADVWNRREELIPEKSNLSAIRLEYSDRDIPIRELLPDNKIKQLQKYFGNRQ